MIAALLVSALASPSQEGWTSLFDGKSLEGWSAKIKGHAFGDNFANTFRVRDGSIVVDYDGYGGKFDNRFGHLFYKSPFSSYILRLDYRFVGKQLPDGPGWAYKNSGIMIHCQDPASIGKDQDFPVSAEVQLLGGDEGAERHTGNLCTPGTNVVMKGELVTRHCTDSTSATFRGEVWVHAEVEVHGSGKVIHRIDGKDVIDYEQIQLDPNDVDGRKLIVGDKKLIASGWISLQSESHPVEFKNIAIKKL